MLARHVQADIDVETQLVAEMPTRQRSTTWARDVLDVEITNSHRMCLLSQRLDPSNRGGCAPEGAAGQVNGLIPGPSCGNCTAPAMQPAAWPPMMCSGPGAGMSRPAAKVRPAAKLTAIRHKRKPPLEPALKYRDDVARSDEGLPTDPALNGAALD